MPRYGFQLKEEFRKNNNEYRLSSSSENLSSAKMLAMALLDLYGYNNPAVPIIRTFGTSSPNTFTIETTKELSEEIKKELEKYFLIIKE